MMLEVRGIHRSFEGVKALDGVSLGLNRGTITSLFGANGSGKSTLLNIICGYLKSDKGDVLLQGIDISGRTPLAIARQGIGRAWQSPRIFRDLSVLDNMLMADRSSASHGFASLVGIGRKKAAEQVHRKAVLLLEDVGLSERSSEIAGGLSIGQQKLLSISMLRMGDPDVLLLDEPFAGVAPNMVAHIASVLLKLKGLGHAILLIEHNTTIAERISDQVLEMHNGQARTLKPLPR